ncbi:MAG: hypothetical protein JWM10_3209 [Myxococcaceae bacterium]|nr:hypothetical protein [Myxococcaceae bacterium]
MNPTLLFSWIHLSDIHIGHGGASHVADQQLVLGALRDDVAAQIDAGHPRPDVILVTGDIAFSGSCVAKDEYDRAARWLREVAAAAGVGPEAVYLVPGNHDVQRSEDKPFNDAAVLQVLRAGTRELDQALEDTNARAYLMRRQSNYLAFAAQHANACRTTTESPMPYWTHTVAGRGGLKVRLVGFNTALLAADEKVFEADRGRLRLGKRQLADAFTKAAAAGEVVIVMSHHPFIEGWLHDEKEASAWTRRHAHIHLSGHVHEASNQQTRSGAGQDFVHISAGAAHGEKESSGGAARHGYSFGAIIAPGDEVVVRVWPRKWSDPKRRFQRDNDAADDETGYATHPLPRVKLPATTPPEQIVQSGAAADAGASSKSEQGSTGPGVPPATTEAGVVSDRVAAADRTLRGLLAARPRLLACFSVGGVDVDAETVARELLGQTARTVARRLNAASAALEYDPAATTEDRRAASALLGLCLPRAVDWRELSDRVREALGSDGTNDVELPLRKETLAELILADADSRAPEFARRGDDLPVGVTQVELPVVLRGAVIPTRERFVEAMVRHLTMEVAAFNHLREAKEQPDSKAAIADVEGTLRALGYERPLGAARPYYVTFGERDHGLWEIARAAHRGRDGLPSLRLVKLAGSANPDEATIVQHVMDLLPRRRE